MVSQFFAPVVGGQERAVEDLGMALSRRGHYVAIVTLSSDGATGSTQENGLTVHRVRGSFQRLQRLFSDPARPHLPPAPDPGAMRAFRQIVDLECPDVVHAHDWFAWSAAPIVRQRGLPFLLSLHDHSLVCANKRLMQGERVCAGPRLVKCVRCASGNYGLAKGTSVALALRWLSPAITSAVDRFLPVSRTVASSAGLGALGLPFEVVPNFVPDSLFDQLSPSLDEDQVTPPLPGPPSRYAIFVGDVTRDKGAAVLLEAHARLGGRPPLLLVGRMLLDDAGPPPESVVVWGQQPHDVVIEAIRRSLFAVVPSLCPETFGLAALEAMALGRPVVAARSGGLQDLVLDGSTGILVPPGDAAALADAMTRLRDHEDLRASLGHQAQSHARTFSESEVVPTIERVYQEVVAARASRLGRTDASPPHSRQADWLPPGASQPFKPDTHALRAGRSPEIRPALGDRAAGQSANAAGATLAGTPQVEAGPKSGGPPSSRTPCVTPSASVDIVIDNYNYARFLGQAIDSALGQTRPPEQVIVVDDGSTDESRDVIASYGDRVTPVLKARRGQASALNEGFRRATSDLIIFLDADDMLLPDIVGRVIAAARHNAGVAKIQYPMEVIDERGRLTTARKPPPHLSLRSGDLRRQELAMPFDMTWMSTSGNAFSRWVLEDLLPIPEVQFARCADWYLQHLTPLFGPVVSLDDVGGRYRVHGANSYEPAAGHLDLEHVRMALQYAQVTRPEIERVADNLGLARPREILSVADLANRLISRRLDPARHPISADTVVGLVAKGMKAAARRFDVAVPMRVAFGAWFVLMAAVPRPIARALAEGFVVPERRAALNPLLGRLHRRRPDRT